MASYPRVRYPSIQVLLRKACPSFARNRDVSPVGKCTRGNHTPLVYHRPCSNSSHQTTIAVSHPHKILVTFPNHPPQKSPLETHRFNQSGVNALCLGGKKYLACISSTSSFVHGKLASSQHPADNAERKFHVLMYTHPVSASALA